MNPELHDRDDDQVEALCPECGRAFKIYVDRILGQESASALKEKIDCPVCGCGQCSIIKPGT
ncbi:MAG: hypothetical protein PHS17_16345 [Desulfobacterales bacterium]|nr:hypothetical protein [Desulfobacterales bacterium]